MRAAPLLFMVVAAVASGCIEADSDARSGGPVGEGRADEQMPDDAVTPTRQTLLSAHLSFSNPVPCDLGCGTAGDDPEIGRFTLNVTATDIEMTFNLTRTGQTLFADNCRLWRGEGESDLVEQAAFNSGTCHLQVGALEPDLYRAVFSTDQLDPTAQHEVDVYATGMF